MQLGVSNNFFIVMALSLTFFLGGVEATAFHLPVNSYLLAFGAFIVPAGRIADMYSYKRLFLVGLALFTLMSYFEGLWVSALQGIGAALFIPCIQPMIMSLFPSQKVSKALGVLMCIAGIGLALGSLLGSILWINIPIGCFAFLLIFIFYPKVEEKQSQKRVDILSLIFLVCFSFCLIGAIDIAGSLGFANKRVLGWFSAAIGFLCLFIVRQTNIRSPMIEIPFLQHHVFIMGTLFRIFMQFAFFEMIFFIDYNLFLPYALLFALFSLLGGLGSARYGIERLMYGGMWSFAIGMFLLTAIRSFTSSYWAIFLPLTLTGFGMGIFLPNNSFFTVNSLPKHYWGLGSAILYMGALISFSVAAITSSLFMTTHNLFIIALLILIPMLCYKIYHKVKTRT